MRGIDVPRAIDYAAGRPCVGPAFPETLEKPMSAMEQSLRRALDAGDAADPAFREAIYSASERALVRMIALRGTGEDDAHAQRVRLAETINRVEEDYFARFPVDLEEPSSSGDAGRAGVHAGKAAPAKVSGAGLWSPGRDGRSAAGAALERRRMRPLAAGLLALAVLLLLGGALYSSVIGLPSFIAAALGSSEASSDAAGAPSETWISLFDGTRLEQVSTPQGGSIVAVTGSGDRPAVRVSAAREGGDIEVQVGPGVVGEVRGRKLRVEVLAGSPDGASREFTVECRFGGETVCGRQRFRTIGASQAFAFDMEVPGDATASGTISVEPGLGADAGNLDLYSVRLRVVGEG